MNFIDSMMDFKRMLLRVMVAFAMLFVVGNASPIEKRSPQEEGEAADPCAGGPWTLFYAFGNWCETGEVGAKAPAEEE